MSTQTTGKSAAAKAAKALLADRIALVETLGEAIDAHEKAQQAVTAAQQAADTTAAAVRDAFTAARAGGWSSTELSQAGLSTPPPARKARKKTTPTTEGTASTGSELSSAEPAA